MKTLRLKEFRQCCYSRFCVQRSDRLRCVYILSPPKLPLCHISRVTGGRLRTQVFYFLVKLFIISTHTHTQPTPRVSPGHIHFAKPLIMLPQMDTSRGRAAHTSCLEQALLCLPFSASSSTNITESMIDSFPTTQPGPRCMCTPDDGQWVDDFPMGAFSLVIFNHPCSHNARTSVRATITTHPPLLPPHPSVLSERGFI